MDRGDLIDAYGVLPRRVRQRAGNALVAVLAAAAVLTPDLRLHERVIAWFVDAYSHKIEQQFQDFVRVVVTPHPSAVPAAGQ